MKKWMEARIKWLSTEEGGRKAPMAVGIKYCPIIEFPNTPSVCGSWSAEINILSQLSKLESHANVSYLSEKAPFELLQKGADFELYEGKRLVAKGIVLSEFD